MDLREPVKCPRVLRPAFFSFQPRTFPAAGLGFRRFGGFGVLGALSGLLSNQGEKSINFYFIRVPLRKKSIQVWYSKAQLRGFRRFRGFGA